MRVVVALFAAVVALAAQQPAVSVQPLVDAEHAFARAAAQKGTRAAFLEFLSEDSVVFTPRPVSGRKSYSDRPPNDALLSWEPEFADISSAGDMGYTTGPWEFRKTKTDGQPAVTGHYMTVWKKQPGGELRAVLDAGVPHPGPVAKPERVESPGVAPSKRGGGGLSDLEAVDRSFSRKAAAAGLAAAYADFAATNIRLYRPGVSPLIGPKAFEHLSRPDSPALTWEPAAARVAESADLGYTYGTARPVTAPPSGTPSEYSYVRIWKKQANGQWRVVLEVMNPIPAVKQ